METSPRVPREVIESCKAGDRKAFETMVLIYQKKVFNIAYRILGNMEEAKDLAQEVFLTVFESVEVLREELKFESWLTQITLNHCRNRWKYLKRRRYFDSTSIEYPIETEDGEMVKFFMDPSENPEISYERKMVQQFVQRGLLKLKEDQRELLVLRDIRGLSYEEIGDLFKLPLGTIKSKIHRARMDLKRILERSAH